MAGYLMTGVVCTLDVRAGQAAVARLHSRHLRRVLRHAFGAGRGVALILPLLVIGALFGWPPDEGERPLALPGASPPRRHPGHRGRLDPA